MRVLRLGVMASGRGSNLQAIMEASEKGLVNASVCVVVSNKKDSYALERARKKGIPAVFVDPTSFQKREDYEAKVVEILKGHQVELVCLAGYMLIVGKPLLDAFPSRIMNIHPALLPAFPGLNAQKRAWEYGVRYSGCTVHFVDEGLDTGPIIIQEVVPVLPTDSAETLAERILEQEHRIYPRAIGLFAQNLLEIKGRKVIIKSGNNLSLNKEIKGDEQRYETCFD